jgi:hypothetical protein
MEDYSNRRTALVDDTGVEMISVPASHPQDTECGAGQVTYTVLERKRLVAESVSSLRFSRPQSSPSLALSSQAAGTTELAPPTEVVRIVRLRF